MQSWITKPLEKVGYVVIGGIVVAALSYWLTNRTPDLEIMQFLNWTEAARAVPSQVGTLQLNYQGDSSPKTSTVYVVGVENVGRAPEKDLKVSIELPNALAIQKSGRRYFAPVYLPNQ